MYSLNRSNKGYIKRKNICQEWGLDTLRDRRWCRKLCIFYKVLENENPKCLILENLRIFRFLKEIFLSSFDHLQTVYNSHNPGRICLITRLRLGLSHLKEHKFKNGFRETLNPLCSCGNDVDSTEHFLLQCPQFVNERCTHLST